MRAMVLDTNIVLDLLLFDDPAAAALRLQLEAGAARWLATHAMREEFERVLAYPKIAPWLSLPGKDREALLACFDRLSLLTVAAPRAPVHCSDADDQIFIDLAVTHQACLLSKDLAVLRLGKRLATLGAVVHIASAAP